MKDAETRRHGDAETRAHGGHGKSGNATITYLTIAVSPRLRVPASFILPPSSFILVLEFKLRRLDNAISGNHDSPDARRTDSLRL